LQLVGIWRNEFIIHSDVLNLIIGYRWRVQNLKYAQQACNSASFEEKGKTWGNTKIESMGIDYTVFFHFINYLHLKHTPLI
jgi:hypothetical protein